ncbi:MAG: OmpA family protein, partial [Desulfuromonadales bacterium]|nr:OmpA family protein [Desulfuromonadales bacterium]
PQVNMPASPPPAPPACNLSANPAIIEKGGSSTLTWSCQNVTDCTMQPGNVAVVTSGSGTATPPETTNFTLVCNGQNGAANSSATVQVKAPEPKIAEPAGEACEVVNIKVLFDFDKAIIKSKYYDELKKAADAIARHPNSFTRIAGHTDNIGTFAHNMGLSQRRADAVRDYLIEHFNIDPKQLDAKGYGYTKPIATNETSAGRAKNRRVEADIYCSPDEKK